jgi:hypothetical protein
MSRVWSPDRRDGSGGGGADRAAHGRVLGGLTLSLTSGHLLAELGHVAQTSLASVGVEPELERDGR